MNKATFFQFAHNIRQRRRTHCYTVPRHKQDVLMANLAPPLRPLRLRIYRKVRKVFAKSAKGKRSNYRRGVVYKDNVLANEELRSIWLVSPAERKWYRSAKKWSISLKNLARHNDDRSISMTTKENRIYILGEHSHFFRQQRLRRGGNQIRNHMISTVQYTGHKHLPQMS